jgi:hypothetical protein
MNCSSGEFETMKALEKMDLKYQYDTSFELKNAKGNWLRWDFIVDSGGELDDPIFIEYDGRQHFKPINFGGISKEKADQALKKTQSYDKLKDNFCDDNGFLILRIPYTQFGNISQILTEFFTKHTDWGFE